MGKSRHMGNHTAETCQHHRIFVHSLERVKEVMQAKATDDYY